MMRRMRPTTLTAAAALTALAAAACSAPASEQADPERPLQPAVVTATNSGVTVTSCRIVGGFAIVTGTILGKQPVRADYTAHLQVVVDGVLADQAYGTAAGVRPGATGRFEASGTATQTGTACTADPLDVRWQASRH
jgi:hypothetical protein